jgi:hypothetical protein
MSTGYGWPMIVRVLTARVPGRNVGEFNHLLRGKLDVLQQQPGLVYAKLARRLNEVGDEEVVLFEEWATPAHLWEWTGGHLTEPRLLPGTDSLIEELAITHYEALDMPVDGAHLPVASQRVVLKGHPRMETSATPSDEPDEHP